jgi:type IV pilus assembly protein PilM
MFNISEKNIKALGLDVSDVSIKVMQLDYRKNQFFPSAYSNVSIASNIIVNHIIAKEDKLAESIQRALAAARNVNTKYVVANVPEAKSFVRILKLPTVKESEIESSIPWELEQDIPVPIDQVYLDWQVIKKDRDTSHVLVTATPKDYVDSLVASIKLAGLTPVALELESQAIARALIGKDDFSEAVMILDMSVTQTSFIVVVLNGILEYTSSIPIAGNSFTESISRSLGVSLGEAERIKIESGLIGNNKYANLKQAMLPILDSIVDEIKNVVRFYNDHNSFGKQITKIYLSGGTAKLAGLADYISARLNLGAGKPLGRVSLGNPWINVCPAEIAKTLPISQQDALDYVTGIGLALRGVNYENH